MGCGRLGSSAPSSALTVALLFRFAGPFMGRLSGRNIQVCWRLERMTPNGYSEPISAEMLVSNSSLTTRLEILKSLSFFVLMMIMNIYFEVCSTQVHSATSSREVCLYVIQN